jgi:hypothetical protein
LLGKAIQILAFVVASAAGAVRADAPEFDRPGIAFSTSTISRGGLAIELGLPGFVYSSAHGSTSADYRVDTNVRTGLNRVVELELATPVYNYDHTHDGQQSDSVSGLGDSSLSLKAALPSRSPRFSWAMLGGATFASGAKAFSNGATQYRLAASMEEQLNGTYTAGFYVQLDDSAARSGYTLSPALYFGGSTLNSYVEASYSHASHSADIGLAGAGVAWMVTPTVQLDLSFDLGLTRASPKVQGGFGVSVYVGSR